MFPIGQSLTATLSQLPVGSEDDGSRITVGDLSSGHHLPSHIHPRSRSNAHINTLYLHRHTREHKEDLPRFVSLWTPFLTLLQRLVRLAQQVVDSDEMCEEMSIPVCVSDDAPPFVTKPHIGNLKISDLILQRLRAESRHRCMRKCSNVKSLKMQTPN